MEAVAPHGPPASEQVVHDLGHAHREPLTAAREPVRSASQAEHDGSDPTRRCPDQKPFRDTGGDGTAVPAGREPAVRARRSIAARAALSRNRPADPLERSKDPASLGRRPRGHYAACAVTKVTVWSVAGSRSPCWSSSASTSKASACARAIASAWEAP